MASPTGRCQKKETAALGQRLKEESGVDNRDMCKGEGCVGGKGGVERAWR